MSYKNYSKQQYCYHQTITIIIVDYNAEFGNDLLEIIVGLEKDKEELNVINKNLEEENRRLYSERKQDLLTISRFKKQMEEKDAIIEGLEDNISNLFKDIENNESVRNKKNKWIKGSI